MCGRGFAHSSDLLERQAHVVSIAVVHSGAAGEHFCQIALVDRCSHARKELRDSRKLALKLVQKSRSDQYNSGLIL
jgi:hypothetical protein